MSRPRTGVTSTRFRCTTGRSDSPIQRITHPSRAPATPITTAQAIVATVGSTAGGTEVSASENVPRPVQLSRPTKTRAPTPEASSPGRATRLSVAPPMPAASMIRKAPSRGEPSSVLIAAKLPAEAITVTAIGGASFFSRWMVSAARPPPIAIRGASGPRTAPRLERGEGGEGDARQLAVRGHAAAGVEPERGGVAAVPGQVLDGQAGQQPAEHQPGHRPPGRGAPGEDVLRQVGEQVLLDLADQGQEAVGDRRDRDAQQRREDQREQVGPGADHRHRVQLPRAVRPPCTHPAGAARAAASPGTDDPGVG